MPSASASFIEAGTSLGRYQLLLPIAQGGMGQVWAARAMGHHGFRRLVALKTILANQAEDQSFVQMFLDEARVASMIHHPNVCTIFDLADEQGIVFLAMEWVNGPSLGALLRAAPQKQLPLAHAVRIVALAAAGLHSAHELRDDTGTPLDVIHRDISPQNILVSVDGHVKVVDFGIAKARGQQHATTTTGVLKGKPHYMAPEQYNQSPLDRGVDIFALGSVLYEAVTGVQAFPGDDAQAMYRIMFGQAISPRKFLPNFPEDLETLIMKSIARERERRFPTAADFANALEAWLDRRGERPSEGDMARMVRSLIGEAWDQRTSAIREASENIPLVPTQPSGPRSEPAMVPKIESTAPTRPIRLPTVDRAESAAPTRSRVPRTLQWLAGVSGAVFALGLTLVATRPPKPPMVRASVPIIPVKDSVSSNAGAGLSSLPDEMGAAATPPPNTTDIADGVQGSSDGTFSPPTSSSGAPLPSKNQGTAERSDPRDPASKAPVKPKDRSTKPTPSPPATGSRPTKPGPTTAGSSDVRPARPIDLDNPL